MTQEVFRKEHVGMTVYHSSYGAGKITGYREDENFCVIAQFQSNGFVIFLSAGGYEFSSSNRPEISFVPWTMPEGWDVPPVEIGEWHKFWDTDEEPPIEDCIVGILSKYDPTAIYPYRLKNDFVFMYVKRVSVNEITE